jgi:hypothetical protein
MYCHDWLVSLAADFLNSSPIEQECSLWRERVENKHRRVWYTHHRSQYKTGFYTYKKIVYLRVLTSYIAVI